MGKYVVALFCDLCKHSQAWLRIPRDKMAGLVGEYKVLAEKVASDYGSLHANFTGDGHLFLFENADAAVQFGLKVITAWGGQFRASRALRGLPAIPLRVGAHFGESTQIGDGEAWVGRVNNVANRIEGRAKPNTVLVSEGMLDLIDIPLYEIRPLGSCQLEGDCVARRTLYRVGAFDEAASAAKPPHELTAEDWYLRAVAMIGTPKENTEEEEACYVQALRLRPDYAEAHYNYGVLLQARGDAPRAEEHYVQALAIRPHDILTRNNYAVLLHAKGDDRGAEEQWVEALRLRPDVPEVHYNYALLLGESGDARSAENHLAEALRLRPDYPEAHNNYANFLEARGDLKTADQHYAEAVRLRPDDADVHYNYALLLQARGDPGRAEEHYRRAYDLSPDDPEVRYNYANLLKARGEPEAAEEHYLEALRLRPEFPEAHYNYAVLLRGQGHPRKAKRHFEQAFRLAPDDPDIKAAYEGRAWSE